jgi:hypothetical protein
VWKTRDIAFIILFSVLTFINFSTTVQFIRGLGIPGLYYADVGGTILFGVSFLLYEGRRWRVLAQSLLILILGLFWFTGGATQTIIRLIPWIMKAIFVDIVLNSLYGSFKRKNKLLWLTILGCVVFFALGPFLDVFFYSFFPLVYPIGFTTMLLIGVTVLFPLFLGLSVMGGYLGFRIYKRVEKLV